MTSGNLMYLSRKYGVIVVKYMKIQSDLWFTSNCDGSETSCLGSQALTLGGMSVTPRKPR